MGNTVTVLKEAVLTVLVLWPTNVALQTSLAVASQQVTELAPLLDWLNRAGITGLLLLALWGYQREWWVTGREFRFMRSLALRALGTTEKVVSREESDRGLT